MSEVDGERNDRGVVGGSPGSAIWTAWALSSARSMSGAGPADTGPHLDDRRRRARRRAAAGTVAAGDVARGRSVVGEAADDVVGVVGGPVSSPDRDSPAGTFTPW